MDDPDLERIRQQRLAQLQNQHGVRTEHCIHYPHIYRPAIASGLSRLTIGYID